MFSGLASINTPASRSFTHALTWGINLAVITNMLQFVWNKTKRSRKNMTFFRKWGPFNCLFLALFLMMADLSRHLVNDAWGTACTSLDRDAFPDSVIGFRDSATGAFQPVGKDYEKYCKSVNMGNEYTSSGNLSFYGWFFTIFCTWSGFALLFVSIFWALSLPQKVAAQWRSIRRGRAQQVVPERRGGERLIDSAA
mmetsp:Transcript_103328/g.287640  ORF Transcript_103328/g.287640 Transcript_103328/m.287640 type:complete len:196 (+) Transcript_103328:300-887(+)